MGSLECGYRTLNRTMCMVCACMIYSCTLNMKLYGTNASEVHISIMYVGTGTVLPLYMIQELNALHSCSTILVIIIALLAMESLVSDGN